MNNHLLCTFVQKSNLNDILNVIERTYTFGNNRVFVFSNSKNPNQYYCTYNVIGEYELLTNTILVHRKSETSTLYTINAINCIIALSNNGVVDIKYPIDWSLYEHQLLLTQNTDIIRIDLKLENVHKIKIN